MHYLLTIGSPILVVALFAISVFLISKKDPTRYWDHCARTLVQSGIAIATLTSAIFIFQTQLAERDAQTLQQQRSAASSFLRSNVLQLVARSKQAVLMSGRMAKCEPDKPCQMTPEEIVSTLREDLDNLNDETQKDLHFALPVDRKEYWQMVRNAGPLIPDDFFDKLMEGIDDYDVGIELGHALLKQTIIEYQRDKEKFPDHKLPPGPLEFHYNKVARLQWVEANIVNTFVCYLSDRVNELRGGSFETTEFGKLPNVPSCAPYSDRLQKASADVKPPGESRLPPEFLKDKRAKQQPDMQ
jgi:hypothetical protein